MVYDKGQANEEARLAIKDEFLNNGVIFIPDDLVFQQRWRLRAALDLEVFPQRLQGTAIPSIWFASM